jgi:hypothetical protein
MQHNSIQTLMAAVPKASLRLGNVGGDKPGILADDQPICRLKEGPVGAAYGALIVGAVNALPHLLTSAQQPAKSQAMDSLLRDQVVQRISSVLAMRPGGKKTQASIWAKLIWTSVETCLAENLNPAGNTEPGLTSTVGGITYPSETVQSARLSAVMEFSCMLLAACEGSQDSALPDMEQLVSEWARSHNALPPTADD